MSQILQELIKNAELIQKSFTEPTTIVVTDRNQYLLHLPADFDSAKIPVGTPLTELSTPLLEESLKTGKIHRMEVGPERLGFPFIVTWNPIIDQGDIVGLLITTTSTEKIDSLRKTSSELAVTVEKMTSSIEEVANASHVIAEKIQKISSDSEMIVKTVGDVYMLIKSIQAVANKSNILGLNAAIEAARAGEYGKGFTVVANEIRRMAEQSKESATNIISFLEKVNGAVSENNLSIHDIALLTEEHSERIQQLNHSISIISCAADELMKTAK